MEDVTVKESGRSIVKSLFESKTYLERTYDAIENRNGDSQNGSHFKGDFNTESFLLTFRFFWSELTSFPNAMVINYRYIFPVQWNFWNQIFTILFSCSENVKIV